MVAHQIDSLEDGSLGVVEAVEPRVEVDAAMAHQRDVLFVNAALLHQMKHFLGIHALHAAARVSDDHHFVHAQLIDGDE